MSWTTFRLGEKAGCSQSSVVCLDQFIKYIHILSTKIVQRLKSHMVSFITAMTPLPYFLGTNFCLSLISVAVIKYPNQKKFFFFFRKEKVYFCSQFWFIVHHCGKVKTGTGMTNSHNTTIRVEINEYINIYVVDCLLSAKFLHFCTVQDPLPRE